MLILNKKNQGKTSFSPGFPLGNEEEDFLCYKTNIVLVYAKFVPLKTEENPVKWGTVDKTAERPVQGRAAGF